MLSVFKEIFLPSIVGTVVIILIYLLNWVNY